MRRLLVVPLLLVVRVAGADNACVDSFEHGQELRHRGKLREALSELRTCAKPECPAFIQRDCNTWTTEVERDLPSLIVAARGPSGEDLVPRLRLDGAEVPSSSIGDLRVDPGEHDLRVEVDGYEASVTHLVIHLGERRTISPVLSKVPSASAILRPPPAAHPSTTNPARTWAWVTGGVAAAGLLTFGVLAIHGFVRERDLAGTCGSDCPHDSVQGVRTEYLIGDVALATGLVAAVVSTILFIASRGRPPAQIAWSFP